MLAQQEIRPLSHLSVCALPHLFILCHKWVLRVACALPHICLTWPRTANAMPWVWAPPLSP